MMDCLTFLCFKLIGPSAKQIADETTAMYDPDS